MASKDAYAYELCMIGYIYIYICMYVTVWFAKRYTLNNQNNKGSIQRTHQQAVPFHSKHINKLSFQTHQQAVPFHSKHIQKCQVLTM